MSIKKTKIRAGTSRVLAETIIGPKKQSIPAETGHERVADDGAPTTSPAQV